MTQTKELEWKDVSEELPLPCQEVLVKLKNGEIIRAYRLPGRSNDPCWLNLQENYIKGEVKEWKQQKERVSVHEKAIEFLEGEDAQNYLPVFWETYQIVRVPKSVIPDLLKSFRRSPADDAPAGLKEQARELGIEIDEEETTY